MSTIVRPYGDTTGDGMVQLSFTLPVPADKRAEGAALQLAGKMGLEPAMVVHSKAMGEGYTFFVVYGRVHHLVDLARVQVVERDFPILAAKEVNALVRQRLRRKLVVGGPRFDELMTAELGVDRIFGRGTSPREVASYLVHAVLGARRVAA